MARLRAAKRYRHDKERRGRGRERDHGSMKSEKAAYMLVTPYDNTTKEETAMQKSAVSREYGKDYESAFLKWKPYSDSARNDRLL